MPGRKFTSADGYRYGFNGMEKDDEIKGEGNSLDFGARMYDSRLGRWFAVDPKTHKFPNESPYVFVSNMPIVAIDPDGEEKIIVVGSQSDNGNANKLMFINQAIRKLREYSGSEENKTILLSSHGYTDNQIAKFTESIEKYGGCVVVVSSAEEIVNYVNSKDMGSSSVSQARLDDKVTNVDAFSHGIVGSISFGYHTEKEEALNFSYDEAEGLDSKAFAKGAVFDSFACRTGLGNANSSAAGAKPDAEKSLAQSISNSGKILVKGWLVRSDYAGTLGNQFDRFFGREPSKGNRENVDGATFTPDGATRGVTGGSTPVGVQQKKQNFLPRR